MMINFASITDFLQMGGYAYYVWPAYGITLFILGAIIRNAINGQRAIKQKLKRLRQQDASHS